jgi:hypothetical protein
VFQNRVLRGIFGPKRYEVTGGWRKLYNEELHNLYPSQNTTTAIKPRRIKYASAYEGSDKCVPNFSQKT